MKLKLPAVVLSMLKKRGAVIDAGLRASKAEVVKVCKQHGYKPYPAVIAFEANFGGLLIPDGPKMKKDEPVWLFGAHACLTSDAHSTGSPRKLVPVVYSPNDIIYYLNEKGQGYAEDTIEDVSASHYSGDGTSLVCRIVFNDALFSRNETSVDLPGLKGDELAKSRKLKLVKEASGKDRRFFTDKNGDLLVVEDIKEKQTKFSASTKKGFKLVKQPDESGKTKTLSELDLSFQGLKELPESLLSTSLTSLSLRRCPIKTLPDALANAKNITKLILTECEELDVDAALRVIARLPKLKDLSLPLSRSLTSLAPLAQLPLKSLLLSGTYVEHPDRLPSGVGQLKKLTDLRIEYADEIKLPEAAEDIKALRLLFSKKFSDNDIRESARKQPEKLYLRAFADTL